MSEAEKSSDAAMRITIDWALCDGNAMCVFEAPAVFELDDNDDLIVLQPTPAADQRAGVEAASRACPKHAITIEGGDDAV
jgi:ferredoxin